MLYKSKFVLHILFERFSFQDASAVKNIQLNELMFQAGTHMKKRVLSLTTVCQLTSDHLKLCERKRMCILSFVPSRYLCCLNQELMKKRVPVLNIDIKR